MESKTTTVDTQRHSFVTGMELAEPENAIEIA